MRSFLRNPYSQKKDVQMVTGQQRVSESEKEKVRRQCEVARGAEAECVECGVIECND